MRVGYVCLVSELLFVGLLPVVVVGFVHKHVAGEEHHVTHPDDEHAEGKQEPELPVLTSENSDEDSDCQEVEQELVTGLTVHFQ